jgi:hypothetical protein
MAQHGRKLGSSSATVNYTVWAKTRVRAYPMLQSVINQNIYAGGTKTESWLVALNKKKKTEYHKCFADYKAMI